MAAHAAPLIPLGKPSLKPETRNIGVPDLDAHRGLQVHMDTSTGGRQEE